MNDDKQMMTCVVNELRGMTVFKDLAFYIYGSRLYGTVGSFSDIDCIVIHSNPEKFTVNPFEDGVDEKLNISVITAEEFQQRLDRFEPVAVECVIANMGNPNPQFKLNEFTPFQLRAAFSSVASNSWVKAKKKLTVEDSYNLYIGLKSAFHAVRLLDFACQILENGTITNFQSMVEHYSGIMKCATWEEVHKRYDALYKSLHTKLRQLAPKEV